MDTFIIGEVKQFANGKWSEILPALASVDPESLDGRHRPCPKCGGSDRFRAFEDFAETGGVICNQCHDKGGDGFATLMWLNNWKFPESLKSCWRASWGHSAKDKPQATDRKNQFGRPPER